LKRKHSLVKVSAFFVDSLACLEVSSGFAFFRLIYFKKF